MGTAINRIDVAGSVSAVLASVVELASWKAESAPHPHHHPPNPPHPVLPIVNAVDRLAGCGGQGVTSSF